MAPPETSFKVGAVRAAVFTNIIQRDGRDVPLPKVVLEVRYRDKAGQWKGTSSLSINDLPKAITALQKAYEYLLTHKRDSGSSEGEVRPPSDAAGPGPSDPASPHGGGGPS